MAELLPRTGSVSSSIRVDVIVSLLGHSGHTGVEELLSHSTVTLTFLVLESAAWDILLEPNGILPRNFHLVTGNDRVSLLRTQRRWVKRSKGPAASVRLRSLAWNQQSWDRADRIGGAPSSGCRKLGLPLSKPKAFIYAQAITSYTGHGKGAKSQLECLG